MPLTKNIVADTRRRKQLGSSNIAILLGAFNKQLFHSRLLDMRSTISYPTCARGIIVKYREMSVEVLLYKDRKLFETMK